MTINKPYRSALYVPAINERALQKSAEIDADWLIFDLEDSVAPEQKNAARSALKRCFEKGDFGRSQTAIRCNATHGAEFIEDMKTVAHCQPNAVLLPKVSGGDDVNTFAQQAEAVTLDHATAVWFMIETASGIANIQTIVESGIACPWKLQSLIVGHNDIASETGVSLEDDRRYLLPWLMQIVLAARQAEIQVLDSVWNNFRDQSGFENEARQGSRMGFDGKTLIHPSQVQAANRLFSPTDTDVAHARAIVEAFSQPENKSQNVINLDGQMVERLHLDQAMRLLEKLKYS